MKPIRIDNVHFKSSDDVLSRAGLLGWVRLTVNGAFVLDGVSLRRTADGRRTLSFPVRTDNSGREHAIIRPLDDPARREIERQVFQALGIEEHETP